MKKLRLTECQTLVSSFGAGYINLLPKEVDPAVPAIWPAKQIENLLEWYPFIASSVRRQQESWGKIAKIILEHDASIGNRHGYSEDDIIWAFHMCLSRAFEGDSNSQLWEAFVPGLVLIKSLLKSSDENKSYVLLPMIDSHNHNSRHANKLEWQPTKKVFELVSNRRYDCGTTQNVSTSIPCFENRLDTKFLI